MAVNNHEGWHFIYWDENPNFTNDDTKVLRRQTQRH